MTAVPARAATTATVLDEDAILAAQGLDEAQWYKNNIPFVDTPDADIDDVYYYRWSTYKRALRYTVPGTGYISTEYDQPVWYSGNASYSGLVDAAGYHLLDGRWLRDPSYMDDYLTYWLRGSGTDTARGFSEWLTSAAYQRYLVTADAAQLKANLPQFIALYNKWSSNYTQNITVNGTATTNSLYYQSPLSDATEYTETSMRSTNWFSGGTGFRPTLNSYLFAAAQAISKIATMTGDSATATTYAAKAAALKSGVQSALWDSQRQFFMHVYNDNSTNSGLAWTRTTWREAMGYTPWAFGLPDSQYSPAWQHLTDPQRFATAGGPTTLERVHDFEAEQATVVHANAHTAASASNGGYVGQIDYSDSAVTFTVQAPGAGTYPVTVYYANATGATSTQLLSVNGSASPITVSYPATSAWGTFGSGQTVTVNVPMAAGANTLKFGLGTGYAELDKITANPYFNYQAYPATQNRDDANCCHWNGPSWPFDTSMILTGLANLLQDYPAQSYVTKQTYDGLLTQFAALQHKDGKPYVAEAANGDTGAWAYDASDFSEHYNHSSFVDLVLTGLLGIKPQAGDTLVLKPLVPDSWTYFAVQKVPYHGHTLSIIWDKDGTHYGNGSGLQVFQDGTRILQSASLAASTTVSIAAPASATAATRLENVAANPWTADQDWFKGWDNRTYTATYPKAFASYTRTTTNGKRCRSADSPRCVEAYDVPLKATDGFVRYDAMPDNRWTNVGSSNATDYLGVDFGYQRPVQEVKIYTYDNGSDVRVPASLKVQYLSGSTWVDVPSQVRSPATPAADAPNEVTFPAVTTSQIRVVFTPQSGKYVGVTELESWYPQRAAVRIVNKNSGLELGIAGASADFGAAVTQQAADGSPHHQWQLEPAENGYYKIVNRNSGLALGINGASTSAGATALQWGDNLTADHLWQLVDAGGGYVKLVNKNSGLLLGISGASSSAGAAALQWTDNGTADHLWQLS